MIKSGTSKLTQSIKKSDIEPPKFEQPKIVIDNDVEMSTIGIFKLQKKFKFQQENKLILFDIKSDFFIEIKKIVDEFLEYVADNYQQELIVDNFFLPLKNNKCYMGIIVKCSGVITKDVQQIIQFDLETFLLNIDCKKNDLFSVDIYNKNTNKKLDTLSRKYLSKNGGKNIKYPFNFSTGILPQDTDSNSTDRVKIIITSYAEKVDSSSKDTHSVEVLASIVSVSSSKLMIGIKTDSGEKYLNILKSVVDDLKHRINDKNLYQVSYEETERLDGKDIKSFISLEKDKEKFILKNK